jgi:hypothetical protein
MPTSFFLSVKKLTHEHNLICVYGCHDYVTLTYYSVERCQNINEILLILTGARKLRKPYNLIFLNWYQKDKKTLQP